MNERAGSRMSWADKIAPKVDRAVERGEPYFEVLTDGHGLVSLMTIDVMGDNTLVYMTRAKARRLIARLQRAVDATPARRRPR